MTLVNTVLGKVDAAHLGFTLMHDHIVATTAGAPRNYGEVFGPDYMQRIICGLKRAKEDGVDTVVDATTVDLGRDPIVLAEASRLSGVNIIAVSGWWLNIPPSLDALTPNQFADLFASEVQEGISGTDVKAGILKAASDVSGVRPAEEAILRGVARAHLKSNAPIMLHSYSPGEVARQQLAILREEGVDLTRVKVDHSNDTSNVEYLSWLASQGCYLGMDRYPDGWLADRRWAEATLARTRTLKSLIDAGFEDHILPSHDWTIAWLRGGINQGESLLQDALNTYGFLFIKTVVFDQLREMGVADGVLAKLCVDNPRRFFEGS